jgi:PAS domain S-box-containing protein
MIIAPSIPSEELPRRAAGLEATNDRRFRIAFRNAAVGMAVVGVDSRFLEVNRALCQILDYTEQELLSRTFQDVTHSDDLVARAEHVRRLVTGEVDHGHLEKRYLRRDGTPVWVVVSSTLIRDAQGNPLHFSSLSSPPNRMAPAWVSRQCVESRPGLKILFMSGYTDDAIEVQGAVRGGVAFLQKPFNALNLTRAVRRILSRV